MEKEIEAKFLDVNHVEIVGRLKELGAKRTLKKTTFRRHVFKIPTQPSLEHDYSWIRLRDEGEKVTLAYKRVTELNSIHGTQEIEVEVNDYIKTFQLLMATGLTLKSEQVTKRETWELGDVQIMLDTWPHVPDFIEVEGPTEGGVKQMSKKLDMSWEDAVFGSSDMVYQRYFNIDGYVITNLPKLDFDTPLPDEIEAKRK